MHVSDHVSARTDAANYYGPTCQPDDSRDFITESNQVGCRWFKCKGTHVESFKGQFVTVVAGAAPPEAWRSDHSDVAGKAATGHPIGSLRVTIYTN